MKGTQTSHATHRRPTKIARVVGGGGSQVTEMTYHAKRMVTSRNDPLGRQTNYTYGTNGLDLLRLLTRTAEVS